jgi:hypothetical protein
MNAFTNLFTRAQDEYQNVECGELEQIIAQNGSNIGID